MSYTFSAEGTVTAPGNLRATGVHCGLKASRTRDLGLLLALRDCSAVGHFGQHSGPAGAWSTAALRRNAESIRAVVVLSGIAGSRGAEAIAECDELAAFFADEAMLKPEQMILLAGGDEAALPLDLIKIGLPRALDELYTAGGHRLAAAMMLSDDEPMHTASCSISSDPEITLGAIGIPQSERLILSTNATCTPKQLQAALDTLLATHSHLDSGSIILLATNSRAALTKNEQTTWHQALIALTEKVMTDN